MFAASLVHAIKSRLANLWLSILQFFLSQFNQTHLKVVNNNTQLNVISSLFLSFHRRFHFRNKIKSFCSRTLFLSDVISKLQQMLSYRFNTRNGYSFKLYEISQISRWPLWRGNIWLQELITGAAVITRSFKNTFSADILNAHFTSFV